MFAETLKEIAQKLEDIHCILLMGIDGLPIEKVILSEAMNVEAITAEFTTILRITQHTTNEVNAGNLEEVIILSSQFMLLTKSITPEYFILLVMPHDGNLGRARFELKKAKYVLEKEFV
jgi:predicted regulator of Ras-like GTPase activity (Roadblock/LC7/MglB family)